CAAYYPSGDAFQMITPLGNAPSGGGSTTWHKEWLFLGRDGCCQQSSGVSSNASADVGGTDQPIHRYTIPDNDTTVITSGIPLYGFTSNGALAGTLFGEADTNGGTYGAGLSIGCIAAGENARSVTWGTEATTTATGGGGAGNLVTWSF